MSEQATFEKVKGIVVEQLGVDEKEVKLEAAYIDDLGADSLDIVELIMAFEEEFNIEIPDDVAKKSKPFKIRLIISKRKRKRKYAIRPAAGEGPVSTSPDGILIGGKQSEAA